MGEGQCPRIRPCQPFIQVCQIGVMTDFEIITLTQDGAVDFKTIAIFLFSKFNRHPFFFRDRNLKPCLYPRLQTDR